MYTYDDFMNTANKAGMLSRFPEQELEAIRKNPELGISLVGLMQDQEKASTAEQRLLATEAANQLRKNYGLGTVTGAGANVVAGSYGDQYAGLLQGPVYQGSFAYDPEKDPVWSAYKKQYAREGERASENAMAQAAAMTGGRPSSYAVTAGQQAGNYYAGQMSDIIPELANDAYQRYIYEQQLKQQNFENALMIRDALGYTPDWAAEILGIESTTGDGESPTAPRPGSPNPQPNPQPGPGGEENVGGIDADVLTQMQQTYPSGTITSKSVWDALIALYGEGALRSAGYSYGASTNSNNSNTNNLAGNNAGAKNPTGGGSGGSKGIAQIAFGTRTFT